MWIFGGENGFCRWRWGNRVLETVYGSSLHVHAQEHGIAGGGLAIAQQGPSLCRRLNIASEENYSAGIEGTESNAKLAVHGQTVKTHDEQLANALAKIKSGGFGHSLDFSRESTRMNANKSAQEQRPSTLRGGATTKTQYLPRRHGDAEQRF